MTTEQDTPDWQRNLYLLAVTQFLSSAAFSAVSPFIPLFIQDLGVSNPSEAVFWTGIAQFSSGFCAFFAGPVWGALADRYGRRQMVIRSTLGGVVIVGLTGISPNLVFLIVMRSLHGMLTGVNAASSALAAAQAPPRRVAFALGLIQMTFFLGTMAGPLAGGLLADAAGYRAPFFAMSGCLLFSLLIVLFFVRERFEPGKEEGRRLHPLQNVRLVLALPNVLPLLGMLFVIRFGPFMLQPVVAVFMQALVTEGAATAAGVALSFFGLASAVTSVLVGRWVQFPRLLSIVLISALLASLFYLPQVWVQSAIASIVLFGAIGLCHGALLTATNSLLSASVSREHQGAVFGLVQSVNAISHGVSALMAGTMSVGLGLRSIFVANAALFFALGLAAWWMLGKKQRQAH